MWSNAVHVVAGIFESPIVQDRICRLRVVVLVVASAFITEPVLELCLLDRPAAPKCKLEVSIPTNTPTTASPLLDSGLLLLTFDQFSHPAVGAHRVDVSDDVAHVEGESEQVLSNLVEFVYCRV
jgi:hypothetical protein